MTIITDLEAQLTLVNTRITALLASPKPDYNVDGQSMSWAGYLSVLNGMRDDLIEKINEQQAISTPYEVVSRGIT